MPSPRKGETEKDYLKRCIPELIHEGYLRDQSAAICYSKYRKEGTEEKSPKPEKSKSSEHSKYNFEDNKKSDSSKMSSFFAQNQTYQNKHHDSMNYPGNFDRKSEEPMAYNNDHKNRLDRLRLDDYENKDGHHDDKMNYDHHQGHHGEHHHGDGHHHGDHHQGHHGEHHHGDGHHRYFDHMEGQHHGEHHQGHHGDHHHENYSHVRRAARRRGMFVGSHMDYDDYNSEHYRHKVKYAADRYL